ncbi:uncharacterized protein LOC134204330 [Armigeres subalbatus]|uniref:uncharacterized protein LOC134204330 n=1 Tax=Armigeres subalbatus TaxID=124917 RepID=UPI002ED36F24
MSKLESCVPSAVLPSKAQVIPCLNLPTETAPIFGQIAEYFISLPLMVRGNNLNYGSIDCIDPCAQRLAVSQTLWCSSRKIESEIEVANFIGKILFWKTHGRRATKVNEYNVWYFIPIKSSPRNSVPSI